MTHLWVLRDLPAFLNVFPTFLEDVLYLPALEDVLEVELPAANSVSVSRANRSK